MAAARGLDRDRERSGGPAVTDAPLVAVDCLVVRRDGVQLLGALDLEVQAGSVHLVMGPNGAGKSTLLRALLGQVEFDGSIRYNWRGSGRIGYVPQRLEIDRDLPMTVVEFLALRWQQRPVCLGVTAAARAQALEVLARVGLAALCDRRLGVLSGGELQRVLLARALVPRPELLLLDEATAGVDAAALEAVERTLAGLRAEGVTTLMVSHDLEHATRVADRVTWLTTAGARTGAAADVLPRRQS